MTNAIEVSDEQHGDAAAVVDLLDLTFGLSRRIKTSYRLREGSHPVPNLSLLVRETEIPLTGCISFWPLMIGATGMKALLLGPLAVHPQRQNRGIGMALMQEGLRRARVAGFGLVLLVGDEPYYNRVGFTKLIPTNLLMPGPVNPERLLYLELTPGMVAKANGLVMPPHRYVEMHGTPAKA
jgi:predicted N-acetyltransferase YhbS